MAGMDGMNGGCEACQGPPAGDAPPRCVFGPVMSRRLGRSLGVDLVTPKTCAWDCVYCQLRRTDQLTTARGEAVAVAQVERELAAALATGPRPDFVTLSGAGEPTLNRHVGAIIGLIRRLTDVPVAVLTSGALLSLPAVCEAVGAADVVLPTLAAWNDELYRRIHRPAAGLSFAKHWAGLMALRWELRTRVWVELFLLEGLNASDEDLREFAWLLEHLEPDRIQLNTVVRPPYEKGMARAASAKKLARWAAALGPRAEVIAPSCAGVSAAAGAVSATNSALDGALREAREGDAAALEAAVLGLCSRHPATASQIAEATGMGEREIGEVLTRLESRGAIAVEQYGGTRFYVAS